MEIKDELSIYQPRKEAFGHFIKVSYLVKTVFGIDTFYTEIVRRLLTNFIKLINDCLPCQVLARKTSLR